MKKIPGVLLMFLLVLTAHAQEVKVFTPFISTKAIANCVTTVGSTSVSATAKPFGAVSVGDSVWGVGIPFGTYVAALPDTSLDSVITLSNAVTQGGTKILSFGYWTTLTATTYGTGDWFGQRFQIFGNTGDGGSATITSVSITENADLLGNVDLLLLKADSDTLGLDSAAVAIVATEAPKILGIISLTTATDLGTARVLTSNNINMQIPKSNVYGRLIARATIGPVLTVNGIKVNIGLK